MFLSWLCGVCVCVVLVVIFIFVVLVVVDFVVGLNGGFFWWIFVVYGVLFFGMSVSLFWWWDVLVMFDWVRVFEVKFVVI